MKKRLPLLLLLFSLLASTAIAEDDGRLELVESRRIWDKAPHNAFTDLIRFKDRWYCVFREGKGHVSRDGTVLCLYEKADSIACAPFNLEWITTP